MEPARTDKSPRRTLVVLLALGAVLLLGAFVRWQYFQELRNAPDFTFPLNDAQFKDYWARALLSGDYAPPPGRNSPFLEGYPLPNPPGYSWFLAGVYACSGGSYAAARGVQFALGLLTVILLFFLGRRLGGNAAGLCAAALAAVYGSFVYYEGELNQPPLVNALLAGLVLLGLWWRDRRSFWAVGLAGIVSGLLILTRPETLLLMPVVGGWLALSLPRGRGMLARGAAPVLYAAVSLADGDGDGDVSDGVSSVNC